MGYKVVKIHQVWQYKTTSFSNGDAGLFTGYINHFCKIKQEASWWPEWCVTYQDKDEFINKFQQREGILLDKTNVTKNKGMRALAKLMLNSFGGKIWAV